MENLLRKYAEICIKIGVNLQNGEELVINSPIECAEFARVLAKTAYENGASYVNNFYGDEQLDLINYDNASIEKLSYIPDWKKQQKTYYAEKKACQISIYAEDPDLLKDVSSEKINARITAQNTAFKDYMDMVMSNHFKWLVISVATQSWASKVYPNVPPTEAVNKLWQSILSATRSNTDDPIEQWKQHKQLCQKRLQFLNGHNFSALTFKNSLGTDITVGLATDHIWSGVGDITTDGREFTPNIPTEEVYTLPHKDKINGKVYSAMPLVYNGKVINDFCITYQDGKMAGFSAKQGEDVLKDIFAQDEGMLSLGEVALVASDSPISNMRTLFYNTLFDENCACHFAIGRGYPCCVKNGSKLSQKQLAKLGFNESNEHIDFMFGTPDMQVCGITQDGKNIPIFKDGNWCI